MSEPASDRPISPATEPLRRTADSNQRPAVLGVLISFLAGALLGTVLTLVAARLRDDNPAGAVSPAVTAAASRGGDIVIPASCRQAVDRAQEAAGTADEAVQALRHLETARLQRLLSQLQQAQNEVKALAAQCRAESGIEPFPESSGGPAPSVTQSG